MNLPTYPFPQKFTFFFEIKFLLLLNGHPIIRPISKITLSLNIILLKQNIKGIKCTSQINMIWYLRTNSMTHGNGLNPGYNTNPEFTVKGSYLLDCLLSVFLCKSGRE